MSEEFGYIRHFRQQCRIPGKCKNMTRIVDTVVSDWAEAFKGEVMNVRRKVLGSS